MENPRLVKLKELYDHTPDDAFLTYAIATEYVAMQLDEDAFDYYRLLLETHPDYVATYYHLGKLCERKQDFAKALEVYKAGMEKARAAKDQHSLAELQNAFTNLEMELES